MTVSYEVDSPDRLMMQENFVSMKASLLVVASFGLVAYGAVQWKQSKQRQGKIYGDELVSEVGDAVLPASFTPPSIHRDEEVSLPVVSVVSEVPRTVRVDRVINANTEYVTLGRSIVVFKNGTSVIVQEPSRNPVSDARYLLRRCSASGIKFKTHQVEHGRAIVAFEEGSVYHWLFPDDVAVVAAKAIDEMKLLLVPTELSTIQKGWNPPLHARLGLTARKWLATDVTDLQVVKILKGSAVAAEDTKVGKVLPATQE